jgi:hypothetical protein
MQEFFCHWILVTLAHYDRWMDGRGHGMMIPLAVVLFFLSEVFFLVILFEWRLNESVSRDRWMSWAFLTYYLLVSFFRAKPNSIEKKVNITRNFHIPYAINTWPQCSERYVQVVLPAASKERK